MSFYLPSPIIIAHELDGRIRLRSSLLRGKNLDPNYFKAVMESASGIESVRVNTRAGSVVVHYDGRSLARDSIINCLADLPTEVLNGNGKVKTLHSILSLFSRGALVLSLLFLPPFVRATVAIMLSMPVVIKGITTLWTRGIKVEALDRAAVLFCLVRRDYFTAGSIVFLLSVGEYLEELSEDRTTSLLKSLLKPQVEKIWIETDGQEKEISVDQARISTFLGNSLRYESESQKKSDDLTDKLVPVTFGLELGLLAVTRDLEKAAAVLTVYYSCAITSWPTQLLSG